MVSLRDQLLAKGIASKKQAAAADRKAKAKRKESQGHRERKHVVEAKAKATAEAEREARVHARLERRRQSEAEREAYERFWSARRLILDSRVRAKGPLKFHFRTVSRTHIDFLRISFRAAGALRSGQAAIAALMHTVRQDEVEDYVLIPASKVPRLLELQPALVVFHVTDTSGISEPEEQFLEPDWEISLVPHKVRLVGASEGLAAG